VAFNRKDDGPAEFVARALGLRRVALNQRFVPSADGQLRAALSGWGAALLPRLRVQTHLESGDLVNLAPAHSLPVDLYWHCWNLDSQVIDQLTAALVGAAEQALAKILQSHKKISDNTLKSIGLEFKHVFYTATQSVFQSPDVAGPRRRDYPNGQSLAR
jgi:hypothetical protein